MMLDNLKRMVIFTHVVEAGSFSGAAKRLHLAKSAVSKHVSLLEQDVGLHLLNRTTRGLSLTDVGETYYQQCARIVELAEEAQMYSSRLREEPRGNLRVACPASFGDRFVAPLLHEYLQRHSGLKAELLLNDDVVDMVAEGIDVAIRVGWLPDSSLRARKLTIAERLLVAAPAYLQRNGEPRTLDDLTQHEWIIFSRLPTPYHCELSRKKEKRVVHIKGRLKSNSASAVRNLALSGAGIAMLTDFLVKDDVQAGRLVHVLPDYSLDSAGIYAVYHDQRLQQPKVRGFIDYLAEHMSR